MAADFPFNFQPTSTVVKQGAYAIPAGFYGKISNYTSDLTIDAALANAARRFFTDTTPAWNVGAGSQSQEATIPADGILSFCSIVGTDTVSSNNIVNLYLRSGDHNELIATASMVGVASATGTGKIDLPVTKGDVIRTEVAYSGAGGVGGNTTATGKITIKMDVPNSELWAPENTALDGSNYIVTLYPMV